MERLYELSTLRWWWWTPSRHWAQRGFFNYQKSSFVICFVSLTRWILLSRLSTWSSKWSKNGGCENHHSSSHWAYPDLNLSAMINFPKSPFLIRFVVLDAIITLFYYIHWPVLRAYHLNLKILFGCLPAHFDWYVAHWRIFLLFFDSTLS